MAIEDDGLETSQQSGLSRRSVMKAAAWSAPVIASVVAAPLAAASTSPPGPVATQVRIGIGTGFAAGTWTPITFTGRTTVGDLPTDAPLPAGLIILLTPSDGAAISVSASGRVGFTQVTENENGSWTLIPTEGIVQASAQITSTTPGTILVNVSGTLVASGGSSWV